jgi:hypothetical protein
MEGAFEAVWWRRDVAMAWVLTRDKTFVQQQFDRTESDIAWDIAFAIYIADRKFSEIPIASKNDAWVALHREMKAGRVRTVGEPFERINYGNGNINTIAEPERDIPGAELISMKPFSGVEEEFFVHIQWTVSQSSSTGNLRGYQRIRLCRADVIAAFPANPIINPVSPTSIAERQEPKRTWNEYDEPHFRAMKRMLEFGSALSVSDAARKVVETNEVAGAGTPESRQKRLQRSYPKWDAAQLPTTPK